MIDVASLNLQKFEGYGSKVSRKIGITKSHSFGIPPAFYSENEMDKYKYATLFYDPVKKVIGIQFTPEDKGGSFKLITHNIGDKKSASFVARSFFNHHNLDSKKIRGRYDPEKKEISGIGTTFLIQIDENPNKEIDKSADTV